MRSPVHVGRSDELERLVAGVHAARTGRGGWVDVVGEAGIGKTRLVREFVAVAATTVTALGRTSSVDRVTPYRPFVEVLLELTRQVPRPVDGGIAPYVATLARFVPHWRSPDDISSDAPALVGEALLQLLSYLARREHDVAIVVLDDLHAADEHTLDVVEYVADHVGAFPVAVVATWRPEGAPPDAQSPSRSTLSLEPLTEGDVAEMVRACLGGEPDARRVAEVSRLSSGLPLLVEDLLDPAADHARGGGRYAHLVAERFARLTPTARRVVVAAALLGEDFDLSTLLATGVADDATCLRAIRDANRAALLVGTDPHGRVRFRHGLTHETILAASVAQRRELAPSVASVLADVGDVASLGRAADLHRQAGDDGTASAVLSRLVQRADDDGLPSVALSALERARDLAAGPDRARLEVAYIERLAQLGRVDAALGMAGRVADEVSADTDLATRLDLAVARCEIAAGRVEQAAVRLDRPGLGAGALVLRARAALHTGGGARRAAAEHLAHQAVAAAAADHRPDLACEALEVISTCARSRSLVDAASALERAFQLAQQHRLTATRLRLLTELGVIEMLAAADGERLERARQAARVAGALDVGASCLVNLAALHAMRGELASAHQLARQAVDEALAIGSPPLAAAAGTMDAVAFAFAGDMDRCERRLRAASALAPDDEDLSAFGWGAGRGVGALLREDRSAAIAAFGNGARAHRPVGSLDTAHGPLLLLHAVLGDATAEQRANAEGTATPGALWSDLWRHGAHAVMAGREGDHGSAARLMETVERVALRLPIFGALTLRLVSEAALHDGWGDPARWLRHAEATFVAGGQDRVASACRTLLARAGMSTPRRRGQDRELPRRWLEAGLTAREVEVLDLVAERLSNKEIGGRLFISPRTVEKHVASLLAKLAVADRLELVTVARRS